MIIGHNRRIAWGVTNLGFDVQDLYREQIDLRTGRYLFKGHVQQARLERDVIAGEGPGAPSSSTCGSRGTGQSSSPRRSNNYSMRWMRGRRAAPRIFPCSISTARSNWDEFNAALARFAGPAQNFVYADVDGNIGYHAAGRLPDAARIAPATFRSTARRGQCEWHGLIPYDDLPHVFNPRLRRDRDRQPESVSRRIILGRWMDASAPIIARSRFARAWDRDAKWQPADMLAVQKDVYSALSHFLAGQIVAAWDKQPRPKRRRAQSRAVDVLRSWNGQMEKGTAAPMLARLAYDRIRNAVAERASPGPRRQLRNVVPCAGNDRAAAARTSRRIGSRITMPCC